jgi:hypothetical protein
LECVAGQHALQELVFELELHDGLVQPHFGGADEHFSDDGFWESDVELVCDEPFCAS